MRYDFEWDTDKARENRTKHKASFEEAATVFLDPRALSIYDTEHSEAEDRWLTLGISSAGRLMVVCHTYQKETEALATIRIISCRKASKREINQYEE